MLLICTSCMADLISPACVPEVNPFAKKAGMGPPKTGIGIGSKKPAPIGPKNSLHKSETFFEKVEAAETSTDPPKRELQPLIASPFLVC